MSNENASDSLTSDESEIWMCEWSIHLRTYKTEYHGYFALFLCIFGTMANILNIIVLTRKEMSTSPINQILTSLAMADMLIMVEYIPFTIHMYVWSTRSDVEKFSWTWSVFIWFHVNFSVVSHTVSICLTLALAIWRFTMIRFAAKARIHCTANRCKFVICSSFVVPIVLNITNLLSNTIVGHEFDIREDNNIYRINHEENVDNSTISVGEATETTNMTMNETFNFTNSTSPPSRVVGSTTLYFLGWSQLSEAHNKLLYRINMWLNSIVLKLIPCIVLTVFTGSLIHALYRAENKAIRLHKRECVGDSTSTGTFRFRGNKNFSQSSVIRLSSSPIKSKLKHAETHPEKNDSKSTPLIVQTEENNNDETDAESIHLVKHSDSTLSCEENISDASCTENSKTTNNKCEVDYQKHFPRVSFRFYKTENEMKRSTLESGGAIEMKSVPSSRSITEASEDVARKQQPNNATPLVTKDSKRRRRTDRTTRLLIVILSLFLITEFPQGILGFLSAIYGDSFFKKCYHPLGEIMDITALFNSAINFILYCLMSHQFRQVFLKLIGINIETAFHGNNDEPQTPSDKRRSNKSAFYAEDGPRWARACCSFGPVGSCLRFLFQTVFKRKHGFWRRFNHHNVTTSVNSHSGSGVTNNGNVNVHYVIPKNGSEAELTSTKSPKIIVSGPTATI